MPSIFISYRREDTSGEAGRLADDLNARFGNASVFIDVDSISPGVNFEDRIHSALSACQVSLVLIGDRWLTAKLPDGTRRLDDERDYVRKEIAAALERKDVTVVPVLVEGAAMPRPEELPEEIAGLARINALELSTKRWRYDLDQLSTIAERYERSWRRLLREFPPAARWAGLGFVVACVIAAAVLIATSGSTGPTPRSTKRAILDPAQVAPKVDECSQQLQFAVDGTAGPLKCAGGALNGLAWQYYAKANLAIMAAGRDATPGQVNTAFCVDRNNSNETVPKEQAAYQLAALYYGWKFSITPDPASASC